MDFDPATATWTILAFLGAQIVIFAMQEVRAGRDAMRLKAARAEQADRQDARESRARQRQEALDQIDQTSAWAEAMLMRHLAWIEGNHPARIQAEDQMGGHPKARISLLGTEERVRRWWHLADDTTAAPFGSGSGPLLMRLAQMRLEVHEVMRHQRERAIADQPLEIADSPELRESQAQRVVSGAAVLPGGEAPRAE